LRSLGLLEHKHLGRPIQVRDPTGAAVSLLKAPLATRRRIAATVNGGAIASGANRQWRLITRCRFRRHPRFFEAVSQSADGWAEARCRDAARWARARSGVFCVDWTDEERAHPRFERRTVCFRARQFEPVRNSQHLTRPVPDSNGGGQRPGGGVDSSVPHARHCDPSTMPDGRSSGRCARQHQPRR
jgi:hypothetical protein